MANLELYETIEKTKLINEFIVTYTGNDKTVIPIELLKFLREKGIKVEDSKMFETLCSFIEDKYYT